LGHPAYAEYTVYLVDAVRSYIQTTMFWITLNDLNSYFCLCCW